MIDNPSFEEGDPDDIWSAWMACADEGFVGDEGTMMVSFSFEPKGSWPSMVGAVPVYKDGWATFGLSWEAATGEFRFYVNSKRRPRWAIGILYRLWYRWVTH
jgi:hypothetical protein